LVLFIIPDNESHDRDNESHDRNCIEVLIFNVEYSSIFEWKPVFYVELRIIFTQWYSTIIYWKIVSYYYITNQLHLITIIYKSNFLLKVTHPPKKYVRGVFEMENEREQRDELEQQWRKLLRFFLVDLSLGLDSLNLLWFFGHWALSNGFFFSYFPCL